jgi:hypothetical protein
MNDIEAARQIRKVRPNTAIVLCSMCLDSQLATVAHDVGITLVLSKTNLGQVIKGVEAGYVVSRLLNYKSNVADERMGPEGIG